MDGSSLTLIIGISLFAAVLAGWVLRWIYEMLNPPPPPEPVADSEWAEYAKSCEAERDDARARLEEVERDLENKLVQVNAELTAAMEGLGDARRTAQDLQAELDDVRATTPQS